MFNFRGGKTAKTAQHLMTERIPSYMRIATQYEVVEGPILEYVSFPGDQVWRYLVRDVFAGSGAMFFILTPFELPKKFWLRKITATFVQYEILDSEDEGLARQIVLAREKEAAQGFVSA